MTHGSLTGKVLALGDDPRAPLAVARSLGRAGIRVEVAGRHHEPIVAASRYVRAAHVLGAYTESNLAWLETLRTLMARERYDLVLPVNDEWATALQRHRDALEPLGRLYVLGDEAFDTLFNKVRTNELARRLGISVPRERVISGPEDVAALSDLGAWAGFPLVLKPPVSHNDAHAGTRHTVHYVQSAGELREAALQMLRECGSLAVQEYFAGTGVGVELLLSNGEPLLAFQHQRVHEPLRGGGSSYRKAVPLTPQLLDAALRLLRQLQYTGVAMVEFRVNEARGTWVLIEVNARFWGSLPLAVAAGADFPLALYRMLVNRPPVIAPSQTPSWQPRRARRLHARNLTRDLAWYRERLRARESGLGRSLTFLAREALGAGVRAVMLRERIDSWAMDDPRPLVEELRALAGKRRQAQQRRRVRRRLESAGARARRTAEATSALIAARSVLFVCKGNICRSPFADHLARRLWPADLRISSAGYYPRPGRPATERAIATARHYGVDLAAHLSRVVSPADLAAADVVFVFDRENHDRLAADYPHVRQRLHFIGALASAGPLLIEDPYGGSAEDYAAVYAQIARAIGTAAEHLPAADDAAAEEARVSAAGESYASTPRPGAAE